MIEIQALTKVFGTLKAVDDLNLSIPKGQTVGFLGPNGAGKTTTIRVMTNMLTATSGSVLLNGLDVAVDPKHALGSVGIVVETPEFYPYLTSIEVLAFLGSLRGLSPSEIKSRSEEVLRLVKLDGRMGTRIGEYSRGMKQRLAIAQAVLHEPEILILDEPTAGLDPRGMVEVREILLGLKKEGYTIFMSSHLLPEVQEVCDSAALVNRGKLLAYDSIESLGKKVKNARIEVTTFSDISPSVVESVKMLPGVQATDLVNPRAIVVTIEDSPSARANLLSSIQGAGAEVTGFQPLDLPLETIYMDLVKESR